MLKSLGPALEKTFGVDAAQLTPEQAERLAACAPEGKVPVTKEQREEAMRQPEKFNKQRFLQNCMTVLQDGQADFSKCERQQKAG